MKKTNKSNLFLISILVIFSTGWFSYIVPSFGEKIFVLNSSGDTTIIGVIINIIVLTIIIIITNIKEKKVLSLDVLKSNIGVLSAIIESINDVCSVKYNRFHDYLFSDQKKDPFDTITQPSIQINALLKAIQNIICKLTTVKKENVSVVILYKFNSGSWNWHSISKDHSISTDQLISNPKTSANQIISKRIEGSLFYHDKNKAIDENVYVAGNKDEKNKINNKYTGSIYCKDISIKEKNKIPLEAILCINTYEESIINIENLSKEKIKQDNKRFEETIIAPFVGRLNIELVLDCIKTSVQKAG